MDDAFKARAEARRARMQGGVARSFDELENAGLDFWQNASSDARFNAIWGLIVDAWIVGGKIGPPPRLDHSVWGVGRFEP